MQGMSINEVFMVKSKIGFLGQKCFAFCACTSGNHSKLVRLVLWRTNSTASYPVRGHFLWLWWPGSLKVCSLFELKFKSTVL